MKKILSIVLIAALALTSAFAGIEGSAVVGLGYNFEDKSFGFNNSTATKVTYELTSEEVEMAGEGSVFAGIKGSFTLSTKDYTANEAGAPTWSITPAVDEAYIKGEDWTVSILGADGGQDFATSALDKASLDGALIATTVAVDAVAAPGVKVTYKDWTVSGGFATGAITTPTPATYEYRYYVEGESDLKYYEGTEAGFATLVDEKDYAIVSKFEVEEATSVKENYLDYSFTLATPELVFGDAKVALGVAVADTNTETAKKSGANLGVSAKASYENEQLSASVASDVVFANVGTELKVDADVAAKFSYAPVTVDAYYATEAKTQNVLEPNKSKSNATVKNLLSAKVAFDLSSFELPVKVAVSCRDILGAKVLGATASTTLDALTLSANADYAVVAKSYIVGASAEYKFEAFTLKAGLTYRSEKVLYANASIESSTLVPGATLSLAYGPNTKDGKVTTNLLNGKYGSVNAKATIKF